ncbi:glycosyltransferase [Pseudoclavibacter terrae]|uniref:D-inositol 3-phosphate glycosyltransferase n=1 Tax=Pseudoclavibacter terrae TaxID=1530195 RepID=A0A7J5B4S7_9MICO|nr:glycosyltransferase [Pseudoclavibacter terrae]KAB1639185.1 glycosyltransferase [Pseudoclavibacter terrae]
MTTKLVYLSDGPLFQDPVGRLGTFAKSASGLVEYARQWPGEVLVTSLAQPERAEAQKLGVTWAHEVHAANLSFVGTTSVEELAARKPAVVMHSVHGPLSSHLVTADYPTVLTDDWSPEVRLEVGLVSRKNAADGIRIRAGAMMRRRRIDSLARAAAGFQCNGHSAFDHYRNINDSTLMFFDHRLRAEDIERAQHRPVWDGSTPLRIAYSGRLTRMKGVHHIPPFLSGLERAGLPVEFTFIGTGEDAAQLRVSSPRWVEFTGFVDFESDWKSMARDSIDLMFLPHVQGDSASTYFEAMGSGVPVLGFQNRTLSPLLARGGGGWAVPMGSVQSAVDVVRQLFEHPQEFAAQAKRGLDFMAKIPFERVFFNRVEHLMSVANL